MLWIGVHRIKSGIYYNWAHLKEVAHNECWNLSIITDTLLFPNKVKLSLSSMTSIVFLPSFTNHSERRIWILQQSWCHHRLSVYLTPDYQCTLSHPYIPSTPNNCSCTLSLSCTYYVSLPPYFSIRSWVVIIIYIQDHCSFPSFIDINSIAEYSYTLITRIYTPS